MKVLIKNVQLQKQFPKIKSLETCSDQLLREVARAYQIGTQKRVKTDRDVQIHGERTTQVAWKYVQRSRAELVKAIQDRAKITIDIPREYWSDEQYEAYLDEGILENTDINVEIEFKERMGIYKALMPYEDLPRHKQDAMFMEVSMEVWEYLGDQHNYMYDVDKNKLSVRRWRPLLYPHEFLADNDTEKKIVEEMNKTINGSGGESLKLNNAMKLAGEVSETIEEEVIE